MKTMFFAIAVLILSFIAWPQAFSAVARTDADIAAPDVQYFVPPQDNAVLTEVLRVEPQLPRGPNDILEDYEAEMANITSQMSHELVGICEAMAKGQIPRERGEYLARERYQIATMQFQLLSALHAILEQSVAQSSAAQTEDDPSPPGQALVLALPFSSLQLNSSLAQYLELTPEQSSAITEVMARERPYVAPLMAELDATRQKLEMATRNAHPDQKQITSLALTQARLLTKLVAENADLQGKISRLLNSEQRRKIERFRQGNEGSSLSIEWPVQVIAFVGPFVLRGYERCALEFAVLQFQCRRQIVNPIQVLVTGCDAGKRTALLNMLEEYGLEPMIASNVEETRQILERRALHVVFCEDKLPDGGFREVLCLVKASRPEIQVVLSSMLGDVHEYIEAMNLGAFDFVAPPYRSSEIASIVDGAYSRYRLRRKDEAGLFDQTEELCKAGKSVA